MTSELESIIIFQIIEHPNLIKETDLSVNLFTSEKSRRLFKATQKLGQNGKPVDLLLLSEETGIKVSEIDALSEGIYKIPEKNFPLYVQRLKEQKISKQFFQETEEQRKLFLKGAPYNFDKCRQILDELERPEIEKESAILKDLNSVEAQEVEWLWPNRIPLSKLSLLVGDPGVGKSYFALWLASHISQGLTWPDLQPGAKGSILLASAEDGIADTIRPRCDAMSCDVSKVKILEGFQKEGDIEFFNIIKHINQLESVLKKNSDARLLIIDPVTAFLGVELDTHRDNEVRFALNGLVALAEKYRIAVLLISHFNKNQAMATIYRAMGSVAFIAAVRSAWAIIRDPEDEMKKRRLFMPLKTNLSIDPDTRAFHIIDGKIIFEEQPVDVDVEAAMSNEKRNEASALNDAVAWLKEALADNPMIKEDILKMAEKNGISERTLRRAREKLNIRCVKSGFGKNGKWEWTLR